MTTEKDDKPTGLIADKGIELLSWSTPNGYKVAIVLQELKEAYGLDVTGQSIDLPTKVQKEPWYLDVCPNGKVPAIVDHDNENFRLWEGTAIITYLINRYDKSHLYSFPPDTKNFYSLIQWVSFASSDLAPVEIQSFFYYRGLPDRYLFPMQKFVGDTERCYGVLNTALTGRDFLVGEGRGKYTMADMAVWPFVEHSRACGLGEVKRWPNVEGWWRRIGEREQVRRGMEFPIHPRLSNTIMEGMLQNEEFKTKEEELEKILKEAKEKFGYEYKAV